MSGLVLVLFFFFAFINMAGKKLNLLTLLWSSYPLTLATFLVELHNTKVYRYLSPLQLSGFFKTQNMN